MPKLNTRDYGKEHPRFAAGGGVKPPRHKDRPPEDDTEDDRIWRERNEKFREYVPKGFLDKVPSYDEIDPSNDGKHSGRHIDPEDPSYDPVQPGELLDDRKA